MIIMRSADVFIHVV